MRLADRVRVATLSCAMLSWCVPSISGATVVPAAASTVTINQSYAYAISDNNALAGDFVFVTSIGGVGCESGWYVKASDPGYKAVVATVLTAQSAGMPIVVYGDNADLWPGSPSGHFCRVQSVGLAS